MSPDFLTDTITERAIYQMRYMRKHEMGSDPVPDDVAAEVRAFWSLLQADQDAREAAAHAALPARPSYRQDVTGADRARRERHYDAIHNEGGEGYNPWRDM